VAVDSGRIVYVADAGSKDVWKIASLGEFAPPGQTGDCRVPSRGLDARESGGRLLFTVDPARDEPSLAPTRTTCTGRS
jgi:hypothetical protein